MGSWLAVGEVVWLIGMSAWIILERRSPVATWAWIFALTWIPLLGIPVYFLFGPRRLRRKKLQIWPKQIMSCQGIATVARPARRDFSGEGNCGQAPVFGVTGRMCQTTAATTGKQCGALFVWRRLLPCDGTSVRRGTTSYPPGILHLGAGRHWNPFSGSIMREGKSWSSGATAG